MIVFHSGREENSCLLIEMSPLFLLPSSREREREEKI